MLILKGLGERKVGRLEGWKIEGCKGRKEGADIERPRKGALCGAPEAGSSKRRWNAINTEEDSTKAVISLRTMQQTAKKQG